MIRSIRKGCAILILGCLCTSLVCSPAYAIDEERLRTFLEGSDYWNVRLSPDGKHLAVMTQRDDRTMLVVLDIDTLKPTVSVKYEESANIEIYKAEWIDNELLRYDITRKVAQYEAPFTYPDMFLLSVDGQRNDRIWGVHGNFENNRRGAMQRGERVRGYPKFLTKMPDKDDEILIHVRSFERRDGAGRGGVYTLNLKSGDTREYAKVPHFTQQVLTSKNTETLVAVTLDGDYRQQVFLNQGKLSWESITLDLPGLSGDFEPFEVTDGAIYATAQSADTIDAPTHIVKYRISTGEWTDVFELGFAPLIDAAVGEDGGLDRVQWIDGMPRLAVLDKSDKISQVVAAFSKSYEGFAINVVSVTDDKSKVLLHIGSGAHAGEYFLFDFETKKARFLVSMREGIDGSELGSLEDATFLSSDGITIPGWFQAPIGGEKLPLVVYIHGGPHGPYNTFSFNTRWHLFNEMGYAVYAPNFRGSGGYGPNFEKSGYGNWGTRMIDDMREGVQALIDAGKVNPDRVCVFGGSYGGYASAQSLVRHNDFYKCGVIIAGIFDMTTQIKRSDTSDWYAGDNFMSMAIGDNDRDLRAISPMFHIDEIRAPMLIIHGTKDERTPFKGAEEFVKALKNKNKRFEYHWYKKEGHGTVNLENQVDEWKKIDAFFNENL